MNFSAVLETINLIMESKEVPLIIGESGIGKTALAHKLAEMNNYYLVTIDANLLKEGEIGGLPIVRGFKTIYATHYKLVEIQEVSQNEDKEILLFIDELNRCEHAVQQELMNLILNREINGYKLSENINIIAAMNPSNKYDGFEDSQYQVVDMDPAQEDRFVWIEMDSDVKEWIRWGMGEGNIENEILEFISSMPEYLHTASSKENIKATPRSWQRISKSFKIYKKSSSAYSFSTFLNVVIGNVGVGIATDFANYISNIKKPLILMEDLFSYEFLSVEFQDSLTRESHSRLYILAKNAINYLVDNDSDKNIRLFSELLKSYPRDLRLGIMKEIRKDYYFEIYDELLDCDKFIESFFEIYL